jgi:hypothetical protein
MNHGRSEARSPRRYHDLYPDRNGISAWRSDADTGPSTLGNSFAQQWPALETDERCQQGEVIDLLEQRTGMHSCLASNPKVASGRRRQEEASPRSTGIGADKPEAR